MRVLYFSRDFTTHDHRFLSSLAETGLEVFFLRLERRARQLEDRPLPPAVNLVRWPSNPTLSPFRWRNLPTLLMDLRGILHHLRPDIVHAGPVQSAAFLAALACSYPFVSIRFPRRESFPTPSFSPSLQGRGRGLGLFSPHLITMSWGSDLLRDADSSRLYRWITRFTLSRTDTLLGDCEAVRSKAATFGFPSEKVHLFPWGIDLDRFSPPPSTAPAGEGPGVRVLPLGRGAGGEGLRNRLGWQDAFVVLSLRSWEPIYGVDVALRGFARAAQQVPELRLLFLGGGSQAPLVHQIIQQYDLSDRVYLGGQVSQNDLPPIYRAADLYLSASHSDGSSVSLMEALASGLPVLVSGIPGNLEWITPGQQGWLFPDGSDQAVTDGILSAVRARDHLPEFGQRARRLAESRADWRKNFKVLLRAYDAALQPTP